MVLDLTIISHDSALSTNSFPVIPNHWFNPELRSVFKLDSKFHMWRYSRHSEVILVSGWKQYKEKNSMIVYQLNTGKPVVGLDQENKSTTLNMYGPNTLASTHKREGEREREIAQCLISWRMRRQCCITACMMRLTTRSKVKLSWINIQRIRRRAGCSLLNISNHWSSEYKQFN